MVSFAPALLNSFTSVMDLTSPQAESEDKLSYFEKCREISAGSVNITMQKIDEFRAMVKKFDEANKPEEQAVNINENIPGPRSKVDDSAADGELFEEALQGADRAMFQAENALSEARRTIASAEIAFLDAKKEFESRKAKMMELKAQEREVAAAKAAAKEAKTTKPQPPAADPENAPAPPPEHASPDSPMDGVMGMFKGFTSMLVSHDGCRISSSRADWKRTAPEGKIRGRQ
jgi:hypothetical protein